MTMSWTPTPHMSWISQIPPAPATPRIPRNDYGVLGAPPALGAWTPELSVSVVIPAYRAERTLPLTLAALARQTYPGHLIEVVVVDDGEEPMGSLPDLVPPLTRVIRPGSGVWGKPSACTAGAEAAGGDVVHFLDADLVPSPEHIEAQMRWHHLADYLVVLGHLSFVPGLDQVPAGEVLAAIEAGTLDRLFGDGMPQWTQRRWDETADLREAGLHAFSVTVGATLSVRAELLRAAGGMDRTLVLGEDTELGYRLAQAGAVFVADRAARGRHIGDSTVMRREQDVKRHNWPYLAERVPAFRWLRDHPHRRYLVPYVEAVVRVADASFEEVRATVDGLLASRLPDVAVKIIGPWGRLDDGRRSPLDDPWLDLRLVRGCYEGETRVAYCESLPEDCAPVPFRLHCPPGWAPSRGTLGSLVKFADKHCLGVVSVALEEREPAGPPEPRGSSGAPGSSGPAGLTGQDMRSEIVHARLERTAALNRARRCARGSAAGDHTDLDDLVHEMFGTVWVAGDTWGLVRAEAAATAGRTPRKVRRRPGRRPPAARLRRIAGMCGVARLSRTARLLLRRLRAMVSPG
ncbi:glycosyltransferase [Sphaerimonospora sp. CA-214678]|uniref:glycosyltransferase n=1 Tax=Sphaerimonospora sp. CA-214678 TaxID=3240029 RepID=UPI003D933DC1